MDERVTTAGWPIVRAGVLASLLPGDRVAWEQDDGNFLAIGIADDATIDWLTNRWARLTKPPRAVWYNDVCVANYGSRAISKDSAEYEILARAATAVAVNKIPGLTAEIGVNRGGGTQTIIEAMIAAGDVGRHHVCIDPYGDLPFAWHGELVHVGYTDQVRDRNLANLYTYTCDLPVNLHFQVLTDTDYFSYFGAGYPIYENRSHRIETHYALVHVDGQHDAESVMVAAQFFTKRTLPGAILVFDDCHDYNHTPVDNWLLTNGWTTFERGVVKKIAYVRDAVKD